MLSAAEQIKPDCCRTPAVVSIFTDSAAYVLSGFSAAQPLLSFILFDWVGVLCRPQLSKALKLVRWARRVQIVQELCESRGGRPAGLSVLAFWFPWT